MKSFIHTNQGKLRNAHKITLTKHSHSRRERVRGLNAKVIRFSFLEFDPAQIIPLVKWGAQAP